MSQQVRHTELREKTQLLLQGAFKHARAAALAAALVPLGAVAVSPAAAQINGSGGTTGCNVETALVSNFNGTRIAAGNVIWFNSVLWVKGLGSAPVTVSFTNSVIQFNAGGTPYEVPVPNAAITFWPAATWPAATPVTTTFTDNWGWDTSVRSSGLAGNTFLDGVAFEVPSGGFPGGINPVMWSGTFTSDTPGVTIGWQWGAAVYSSFDADENALDVKPVDDNKASTYQNSDHAGTPEAFKKFVLGGARGGGGSNFTGSYSGSQSTECQ